MNRLDKEIMKAILMEKQSKYKINEYLKKELKDAEINVNYTTVWRHIATMEEDGLLDIIKTQDGRKTEIPKLTSKGLATLLIDGELEKKELKEIQRKVLVKLFKKKLPKEAEPMMDFMADVSSDALLGIRPKVNLKFFDEKWFYEASKHAFNESALKAVKKYRAKFEKEGIWATEKELEESPFEKMLSDLIEGKINSEELRRE